MPSQLVDATQRLDAAIAASRQSRRDRLLRRVRRQRTGTRVVFGLAGCQALLGSAAFFLADDPEAAAAIAMMTCITFGFACIALKVGRKKAVDALRELDQSA
jgi:heme A synthase